MFRYFMPEGKHHGDGDCNDPVGCAHRDQLLAVQRLLEAGVPRFGTAENPAATTDLVVPLQGLQLF
jgi:hypothetical protein